jgi:ABC-type antimicrobial peptide transport system permease subunit
MTPHQQPLRSLLAFLGVVFAVAFVVYLMAWRDAPYSTYDTASYQQVARDLQDGALNRLHDRTVGYPLVLLLTQSAVQPSRALFVLQLLLHFAAVTLLVLALHRHGISPNICSGVAVGGVLPPFLVYTAFALTESLLAFCVVLTFWGLHAWLFARSRWGLMAALVGTVWCGMIRPSLFGMGMVCALLLAVWSKREDAAIIGKQQIRAAQYSLIAVPLMVCVAMVGFNRQRFHYTGLTPMMWKYLSTKTVRLTERIPDTEPVKAYLVEARDQALIKPNSYHNGQAYMHDLDDRTLAALTGIADDGERAQYLTRLQGRLITGSPMVYLLEVGAAMVPYWFPAKLAPQPVSGVMFWLWVVADFALIGLFFAVSVLLLSALFLLRQWNIPLGKSREAQTIRQSTLSCLLALTMIGYHALVSPLFSVGEPRYRYPTDLLIVFFLVLAYHTLRSLSQHIKQTKTSC